MILAVITGLVLVLRSGRTLTDTAMGLKFALIAGAVMLSVLDGWLIYRTPAWTREVFGVLLLVFNLGIFGAAVAI